MIITDSDENPLPDLNRDPGLIEDQLYAVETAKESTSLLDDPVVSYIYESSPVILPITWGASLLNYLLELWARDCEWAFLTIY